MVQASEIYAQSQGNECTGNQECHWCSAPCKTLFPHEDQLVFAIQAGIRSLHTYAKRPGNTYICMGCWLWRRRSITVFFIDKDYKDRQKPMEHSWLITPDYSKGILADKHKDEVYNYLLSPDKIFTLMLLSNSNTLNHLHCGIVNSYEKITAETELFYTLDNKPMSYTIYELEDALTGTDQGKSPGVRMLVSLFGTLEVEKKEKIKRKVGRPTLEESSHFQEHQRMTRIVA